MGTADDAPVNRVYGGVTEDGSFDVDKAPQVNEPRHNNWERQGVPPLRFIEMYLASAAEEEVKESPKTVQEALQGSHGEKWQKTMDSEMESLRENGVYEIVARPAGK